MNIHQNLEVDFLGKYNTFSILRIAEKVKINFLWKTHIPPPTIPLTQTHLPDQNKISINNRDTNKPSQPSLTERLILYFSNENKLNKAKLLLEYFKNIIDNDGNTISPPNTDKNVV